MSLPLHSSHRPSTLRTFLRQFIYVPLTVAMTAAGLAALIGHLEVTLVVLGSLPLGAALLNGRGSPEPEDPQAPGA